MHDIPQAHDSTLLFVLNYRFCERGEFQSWVCVLTHNIPETTRGFLKLFHAVFAQCDKVGFDALRFFLIATVQEEKRMTLHAEIPQRISYDETADVLSVVYDDEIVDFTPTDEYDPDAKEITVKTIYTVNLNEKFNVYGVANRTFKNVLPADKRTFSNGEPREFRERRRCRHLCTRAPISTIETRPWLKDPDRPVRTDRKGTLGHYEPQFDGKAAPAT